MTWALLMAANATQMANFSPAAQGSPWLVSVFRWLKDLPTLQRGQAGARIFETYANSFGYSTQPAPAAQSFRMTPGVVKVKTSMLWTTGHFKFQQIEDDGYDHLALLGLEPASAWLWICTKKDAFANATAQHKSQSRWIVLTTKRIPPWLIPRGGPIAVGATTLQVALGPPP